MDFGFIFSSGISNGLIWAILAIGVYITYRILDIADLGVEGTFPLGGCVVAILISVGVPPIVATIIAMIVGSLFGILTGILHTKLKIPAILSGIITMTALYTINMLVLGGFKDTLPSLSINNYNKIFTNALDFVGSHENNLILLIAIFIAIASLIWFTVITVKFIINVVKKGFKQNLKNNIINVVLMSVLATVVLVSIILIILNITNIVSFELLNSAILDFVGSSAPFATCFIAGIILSIVFGVCYWFFGTEIGMSLRATGNNKNMAKAQGINTNAMILLGLAISNGLVALCGAVFVQDSGNANVVSGQGTIVIGLATIILGESIFGRQDFKKSLISVIVGSIIYFILEAAAIDLNVVNYLKLVRAVLIVCVLVIPLIKKQINNKKRNVGGLNNA